MTRLPNGFDLPRCGEVLSLIETDLGRLISSLTESQFHAPPRTGGWSIAYCIEHLILTGHAFMSEWDTALKSARANGHYAAHRPPYAWWQRSLLYFMEPPYR